MRVGSCALLELAGRHEERHLDVLGRPVELLTHVGVVANRDLVRPERIADQNALGLRLVHDDAPRVRWRGLMIDTARHYLSISTIKQTVDAMAATKMNDLHWVSGGD